MSKVACGLYVAVAHKGAYSLDGELPAGDGAEEVPERVEVDLSPFVVAFGDASGFQVAVERCSVVGPGK